MRRPDWPQRLVEYVEAHRQTPFAWGTHDCCRFAAGAVEAMTDENPMAAFDYGNERQALRLIRDAGTLDALMYRTLGESLPSVAYAKRGDVVISDLGNGPTVGVVLGADAVYAAPVGLFFQPAQSARAAWRIS